MIYQKITLHAFRDAFDRMGRGSQFTFDGLEVIFDYLASFDDDVELDVIAICCDFAEDTLDDLRQSLDMHEDADVNQLACELTSHTVVIGTTADTIVYVAY